jgi:hypothetical protein
MNSTPQTSALIGSVSADDLEAALMRKTEQMIAQTNDCARLLREARAYVEGCTVEELIRRDEAQQ